MPEEGAGFRSTVAEAKGRTRFGTKTPHSHILTLDRLCLLVYSDHAEVKGFYEPFPDNSDEIVHASLRLGSAGGGLPSRRRATLSGCSSIQGAQYAGAYLLTTFAEGNAPQSLNPFRIKGLQNTGTMWDQVFSGTHRIAKREVAR